MRVIIAHNNGDQFQVSDEDYDFLNQWIWSSNGYMAERMGKGNEKFYLHHEVILRMGLTITEDIDHRDRDRFNNQRHNLRPATRSQNNANIGLKSNNTSGYKGVRFNESRGKWQARISRKGVEMHLGYFETPRQAAEAYNRAAKRMYGAFASLNEI